MISYSDFYFALASRSFERCSLSRLPFFLIGISLKVVSFDRYCGQFGSICGTALALKNSFLNVQKECSQSFRKIADVSHSIFSGLKCFSHTWKRCRNFIHVVMSYYKCIFISEFITDQINFWKNIFHVIILQNLILIIIKNKKIFFRTLFW